MIVWGGINNITIRNTGGRYDPGTDSWKPTSTTNAPVGREAHTAVWTGGEMIVWGGDENASSLNTGGRYDPGTDNWTATSTSGVPAARFWHSAVWTGGEMIVWGGYNRVSVFNTGAKYCAQSGSSTPTPTPSACTVNITNPGCDSVINTQPVDFFVNLSDPTDPSSVQPTDFTVNGTPADSYMTVNFFQIVFH